ncbi:MAG TPA: hypothetical protein VE821_05295, partial [Pyrinomonadaceae bacterium]|nr:hypothetical protein [Pyrinomonadaceae bacterium]
MDTKTMTSNWQAILKQVESIQEKARRDGYPLWYRGHRLSEWKLQSGLHRHVEAGFKAIGRQFTEDERVEMMRSIFKSLY